jgi:hypothetical protein
MPPLAGLSKTGGQDFMNDMDVAAFGRKPDFIPKVSGTLPRCRYAKKFRGSDELWVLAKECTNGLKTITRTRRNLIWKEDLTNKVRWNENGYRASLCF